MWEFLERDASQGAQVSSTPHLRHSLMCTLWNVFYNELVQVTMFAWNLWANQAKTTWGSQLAPDRGQGSLETWVLSLWDVLVLPVEQGKKRVRGLPVKFALELLLAHCSCETPATLGVIKVTYILRTHEIKLVGLWAIFLAPLKDLTVDTL